MSSGRCRRTVGATEESAVQSANADNGSAMGDGELVYGGTDGNCICDCDGHVYQMLCRAYAEFESKEAARPTDWRYAAATDAYAQANGECWLDCGGGMGSEVGIVSFAKYVRRVKRTNAKCDLLITKTHYCEISKKDKKCLFPCALESIAHFLNSYVTLTLCLLLSNSSGTCTNAPPLHSS